MWKVKRVTTKIDEGAWIQTYTGYPFPILHPSASDIDIEDIAHALSNLCRFAGHTREFYSVAQHSVLVSHNLPVEHRLTGLLHDAPEAYIVDIPRPLKHSGMVEGYKTIEDRVWAAIAERFSLSEDMDPSVKQADVRALFTEQRDLMGRPPKPWKDMVIPYPEIIVPLPPKDAKAQFLIRYYQLQMERYEAKKAA